MRMKHLILTAVVGLMPFVGMPSWAHEGHMHQHQAQAQDNITVVVNLTRDKAPSAVMAIRFATVSLERGNPTVVWLNSEGVRLADAKAKPSQASKMLQEFISKGGKVYVCPHCANALGVKELVKGAEFGKPDVVFGLLSEERVRVISW